MNEMDAEDIFYSKVKSLASYDSMTEIWLVVDILSLPSMFLTYSTTRDSKEC